MDGNICRFVPEGRDAYRINILYYVLETKPQLLHGLRASAFYTMYLALDGEAALHTASGNSEIHSGDLFFSMPSVPFAIESKEGFRYIYISYMGPRANALMEMLKINPQNCVFHGHDGLKEMWLSGLDVAAEVVGMRSESILLYTFSEIGLDILEEDGKQSRSGEAVFAIKKYIDENFSDPEMSLESVGRRFSYNPKYVSALFKRRFNVNFSEYLNIIRIQHSCALMERGFTCVKDIALLCGFRDPMYFSRVFKKSTGKAPRRYCEGI